MKLQPKVKNVTEIPICMSTCVTAQVAPSLVERDKHRAEAASSVAEATFK